jgi:type II secretory ATPase GspE/PulE/Tfp pilus assembly ATPase PilB-like protein
LAEFARERRQPLIQVLVGHGGVDEQVLIERLAKRLDLPFLAEEQLSIPESVLLQMSPALAISRHVIPVREEEGRLWVAGADPFDWSKWDELAHVLGRPVQQVLCPRAVIGRMLTASYGIGADTVERLLAGRDDDAVEVVGATTTDLSEEEAANEPTVVNLVNRILSEAIRANATDIHFEPYDNKYRVRYRIDGMLEDVSIPVSVKLLKLALVSRIKIMSNLDITEKRLPQDGRCQVSLARQDYDLRVSILPGVHGEAVAIRLQSRQMVRLDLTRLGFEPEEQERIALMSARSHGLMLVTGPTGSGKTTTLYACLSKIMTPEAKIITVEDPVEYWTDDILQMQIHEEIGFTFARALRSMLRHDPDVMLVGEVRDRETADMAIRSSLTGHLVLATIHTNDASSAITRLTDIGIEPFLLSSSARGILAQRLVRRVCANCREEAPASSLGQFEQRMLRDAGRLDGAPLWRGCGCERCRFTGYRGRRAIGEALLVSASIRQLIQQRGPADRIKEAACREGMRTLRETAVLAALAGDTTMAEVLRVTQEDF